MINLNGSKLDMIISKLKEYNAILGFKIEFEAEGASVEDLIILKQLGIRYDLPVFLKIGGVEALSDMKQAKLLSIDGIIAPMVESAFGAIKFVQGAKKIYGTDLPVLSLTIETDQGYNNVLSILDLVYDDVQYITFGRTDYSASFFNSDIFPDSEFVLTKAMQLSNVVSNYGLKMRMGGSIKNSTINLINSKFSELVLHSIETRKVISDFDSIITNPDVLKLSLEFEKELIKYRKKINDDRISDDLDRLIDLESRKL
jgi:4-hydroxy-2-oxoheptanedioate aldolase